MAAAVWVDGRRYLGTKEPAGDCAHRKVGSGDCPRRPEVRICSGEQIRMPILGDLLLLYPLYSEFVYGAWVCVGVFVRVC